MTDEELQRVENFEVRHKKHGRIVFQGTTDLRGLDLDQLIVFGNRTVDVYPDESVKPPMGQGLNKPARITLCDIFPGKNASAEQVADKLRRFTAKQDAEFLSYSAPEGEWSFRVEHFSRYGLLDEEDEEEQGEQQEAEERMDVEVAEEEEEEEEDAEEEEGDVPPRAEPLSFARPEPRHASAAVPSKQGVVSAVAQGASSRQLIELVVRHVAGEQLAAGSPDESSRRRRPQGDEVAREQRALFGSELENADAGEPSRKRQVTSSRSSPRARGVGL